MIQRFVRPRVGLAGLLGVLSVLAFGVTVAQADDVVQATFNGTTTHLGSPTIATPFSTASIGSCAGTGGVQMMGGTGCFEFAGSVPDAVTTPAYCIFTDPQAGENNAMCSGTIKSDGNFANDVCGTGTATGVAEVTLNNDTFGEGPIWIYYSITFASGAGTLTVNGGSHFDGADGPGGNGSDAPGLTGGGTVDITPTNTGGCVTGPALGFNVHGDVTLDMADQTNPS